MELVYVLLCDEINYELNYPWLARSSVDGNRQSRTRLTNGTILQTLQKKKNKQIPAVEPFSIDDLKHTRQTAIKWNIFNHPSLRGQFKFLLQRLKIFEFQ